METIKCIKERRSVRKFQDRKVPHEIINEIVDAAAYAPSWKNTQVTRYIVTEDQGKMNKIADSCVLGFEYNIDTLRNAPALVIVTMIEGRSGLEKDGSATTPKGADWGVFDTGIAAQTFCLAAHDKGVGSVIMGIFDENKVSEVVEIPEGQKVAALIAIGYPDEDPKAPRRKSVSDLVTYAD
ncbi:nitroreductase family protein [Anaerovorax odorimutans]|uniref:Nitroreductase family protein n=1 Tax=Anaerovorax odorimutans TaxID=109327 RepID=A0ABT1RNZ4_9FIRM|nr:nitroreductase family protein [Anaerovorax odorimutans]MCQ4636918.1 nitroreductase family protein [Anaerovorax odorimutans]